MKVIIGAGLTGLSAAYHLQSDDYVILERCNDVGGTCSSCHQDGFTFDHVGHVMHFRQDRTRDLAKKVLGDLKREHRTVTPEKAPVSPPEEITKEQWEKIDEIIMNLKDRPGALIPVLQGVQEAVGYLPPEVQKRIAKGLNIPTSEVLSVVTFYSFFTMVPRGKHVIRVCLGTACYVKGGNKILSRIKNELGIQVGETTEDMLYTLEAVRCLGACGLAPVMVVGNNVHGRIDPPKVMDILASYE